MTEVKESLWKRLVDLALTLLQIACYAGVPIGAGHGMGPIGYFLLLGWSAWRLPVGLGWLSVGVVVLGQVLPDSWRHRTALLGIALMFLSWLLFLAYSEMWLFSTIFSLPYLAVTAICVARIASA